jgi:hypothetical protein
MGPSSSKCLSALLLVTTPVFSSRVAKFDCRKKFHRAISMNNAEKYLRLISFGKVKLKEKLF